MPRGGYRPGAGRKPKVQIGPVPVPDKHAAMRLSEALNRSASDNDSQEVKGWRLLWDAQDLRIRLDVRKYLYDRRDGKARQMFEHLGQNGEPIKIIFETNVKLPNG